MSAIDLWIRWPAREGEPFQIWQGEARQSLPDWAACLSSFSEETRAVILLPAVWCSTFWVSLPAKLKSKRQQAALFAVEDQLAVDVGTVHTHLIAKPTATAVDRHEVLVIQRSKLDAVYQILATSPHKPMGLAVETSCFAQEGPPDQVAVWTDPMGYFFLRQSDEIRVFYPEEKALLDACVTREGLMVRNAAFPLPWVWDPRANWLVGQDAIYQKPYRWHWKRLETWVWLVWGVIALLGVGERLWLDHEVAALDQSILAVYQEIAPNARHVVPLKSFLARLPKPAQIDPFFPMAADFHQLLQAHPGVEIRQIERRGGNVSLDLILPSSAVWDGWLQTLKSRYTLSNTAIEQIAEGKGEAAGRFKGHLVLRGRV